jgi:hypothetical protein
MTYEDRQSSRLSLAFCLLCLDPEPRTENGSSFFLSNFQLPTVPVPFERFDDGGWRLVADS